MKGLKRKIFSENKTQKSNNKKGMTYIELLCALSLLMLIVVMFSPMLLKSYDTLYTAGERTSETYHGKSTLEENLSFREKNDNLPGGLEVNFKNLASTLVIRAKQAVTSVEGLETLYSPGKGKIAIVSDLSVPDNQSSQLVKLKLTNLDYTSDDVPVADSYFVTNTVITDKSQLQNKVAFYFASAFDPNTAISAVPVKYPNFDRTNLSTYYPYIDILLNNIDITKSPIKIMAFYLNEFGNIKTAIAHLYITPADVMFVGETGSMDYFTSAGIDEDGNIMISGRDFLENSINGGGKLNDVEWVSTNNDSTINEGYYIMCGDNSIVRRLWHLDLATLNVGNRQDTFGSKDYVYFGEVSYPFKWGGDYMDVTALSDDDGVDLINYGDNSDDSVDFNGDQDNHMTKNEYHLNDAYYSYYVNGYTSAGNTYANNNKRISYALEESREALAANYNVAPEAGVYIIKGERGAECNRGESAIGDRARNRAFVYCTHCNQWCTFGTSGLININVNNVYEYGYSGPINYKTSFFTDSDGYGNAQISSGAFSVRHCVPKGNGWASSESATTDSIDENLSCVILKAYNTVSPAGLTATSTVNATEKTADAKPNLKACVALPGNRGDALYVGSLDSSALINTTKAVVGGNYKTTDDSSYTVDQGYGISYVYIGDGEKTYRKVYDQTKTFDITSSLNNGGKLPVKPNAGYGYNSFKTEYASNTHLNDAETISDLRFTMGYSSDMYKVFNTLNNADKKPFEQYYSASTGITDTGTNSTFRQNLWFPREFFNVSGTDTFGNSVVACGYDVGGYSQMDYVHLADWTTTTNTRYLYGDQDMDWDNNGIIDYFDPASDKYNTIVPGETKIPGVNTPFMVHTFNKDGHNCYFIDAQSGAGAGDGTKTVLALPRHVALSTLLDKVNNNAVLSVYNESEGSEGSFTPILYYKDVAYGDDMAFTKNNVRFNCVSVTQLSDSKVGIAAGTSNGKIFVVTPDYVDGKISTASIRVGHNQAKCKWWDLSGTFASIDAVKAFNHQVDGVDYYCLLFSGKSHSTDTPIVACATFNKTDGSLNRYCEFIDAFRKTNFGDADITDICVSNGYMYAVGYRGDLGVIYTCSVDEIVRQTLVADGWNLSLETLKKTASYSTQFSASGDKVTGGNTIDLPRLNSVAAIMELD